MPSLKVIRTRIASVKNTQKITRAMKLVAAARMRRAQESIVAARPYAKRLGAVISDVAARATQEEQASAEQHGSGRGQDHAEAASPPPPSEIHPLLDRRRPRKVALVVLTSDRGLCGGFNANIGRRAEAFLAEHKGEYEIVLSTVGRKGREYFRRRKAPIKSEFAGVTSEVALQRAKELTQAIIEDYTTLDLDAVYLVYNEFKSAIQQKVVIEPLLPVEPAPAGPEQGQNDFLYEPSKRRLLSTLLPLHVEVQIYRSLLESIASEFGARMTAMDSATKNAKEMISRLTLAFNRARQAAITKELMEIVSGAEALK
jgi:F-type H+-transporting ATPase subunit gamma